MIDYSKYKYNGWGLSKEALKFLEDLVNTHSLNRAIEFGSGQSTYFLEDLGVDYVSFDNNPVYAAQTDKVVFRNLRQLDDNAFDSVITNKVSYFDICNKFPQPEEVTLRTANCFYGFEPGDIEGKFDLVIIDGPNGNGRSLAFNAIKNNLSPISYLFIDDYNHYPFIEHLKIMFPNSKLIKSFDYSGGDNRSSRDYWQIYKVTK